MIKDVLGQDVDVGDTVCFVNAYTSNIVVGVVHKVNEKSVSVTKENGVKCNGRPSFVKVDQQYEHFKKEHPELFV